LLFANLFTPNNTFLFVGVIGLASTNIILTVQKFGILSQWQFIKTCVCSEVYLLGRTFSLIYRARPAARDGSQLPED
jgi:hypothetical protein